MKIVARGRKQFRGKEGERFGRKRIGDRRRNDLSMTLEAIGIGRQAGGHWLLNEIFFSVHAGHRIAVAGPTGSGKTLLLRSLAMLDPLDAGEVRWHGKTVRGSEIPGFRSRVIYLHQRPALAEGTVEDNLRKPFSLRVHRDKRFQRDRIVRLLKSLGREESFLSKQTRELSGGEAQLSALLRAIQLDAAILLLDEPTASLDAEATRIVEALVGNWIDERPSARAAVWVTHDHEQANRVSTSVLTIHRGQLTETKSERIR